MLATKKVHNTQWSVQHRSILVIIIYNWPVHFTIKELLKKSSKSRNTTRGLFHEALVNLRVTRPPIFL